MICVETRHMRAVLKAQINKTDRNDARGIAQMMRVGLPTLLAAPAPVIREKSQFCAQHDSLSLSLRS